MKSLNFLYFLSFAFCILLFIINQIPAILQGIILRYTLFLYFAIDGLFFKIILSTNSLPLLNLKIFVSCLYVSDFHESLPGIIPIPCFRFFYNIIL